MTFQLLQVAGLCLDAVTSALTGGSGARLEQGCSEDGDTMQLPLGSGTRLAPQDSGPSHPYLILFLKSR